MAQRVDIFGILCWLGVGIAAILAIWVGVGFVCQIAEGGQNANDVAFHIAGGWIPDSLGQVIIRDTSDTDIDTIVQFGISMAKDSLYAVLYNALGGTVGVSTWEVVVFDSADNPVDTINVTEDYADLYAANYWVDVYTIIVRGASEESLFVITAWQDTSDLYYENYAAPYAINVLDSLGNILYTINASEDNDDVYLVNHWNPHYSISVLDSVEAIIYTISALQDSPNTYIDNWLGQTLPIAKIGVPGTNDYCKIAGVVQGPEGTRITNAVVHFKLKSHFPVFWGNVLITQINWKTTTDDTGGIELSLLRNGDLSDTLSYYEVNVIKAGLRNAKAVIPAGYNTLSWQSIFTTQ